MSKRFIERRTVLRGVLGGSSVAIGLPLLEGMLNGNGDALAQGTALAARPFFISWFSGGGPLPSEWTPKETGPGYTLSQTLQGLAATKEYVTVVSGGIFDFGGLAHSDGHPAAVSGTFSHEHKGKSRGGGPTLPSIDQIVADQFEGDGSPIKSMQLGIHPVGPYKGGTSFRGSGQQAGQFMSAETDPGRVFNRLFGGGLPTPPPPPTLPPAGGNMPAPKMPDHKRATVSVLDAVLEHAKSLETRLSAPDKVRLDAHLSSIEAIENQIKQTIPPEMPTGTPVDSPPPMPGNDPTTVKCEKPAAPGSPNNDATRHAMMSDLMAMALSCGITRVFSLEWSAAQSEAVYPQYTTMNHHRVNHYDRDNTNKIARYIVDQFGVLLKKLKDTPYGAGNLLDNTAVYHTWEYMDGGQHSLGNPHPVLICGRGGGKLKAGVHHAMSRRDNMSKACLTVLRGIGINAPSFGEKTVSGDAKATEIIPGLLT